MIISRFRTLWYRKKKCIKNRYFWIQVKILVHPSLERGPNVFISNRSISLSSHNTAMASFVFVSFTRSFPFRSKYVCETLNGTLEHYHLAGSRGVGENHYRGNLWEKTKSNFFSFSFRRGSSR